MRLVKPDHTTISYPCLREHPHTCCILVLSRSSSQDPNRPCWYPQASFPAGHPTVSKTPPFQKRESMLQLTFRNSNHQEWLRHWAEASTCNFITVFQWENVTCILPKSSPPQATPHSPRYSDCKSHPKGPPCRAPHSPEDEVFSKDVSFWRFFTDCQCQYLPTSVDHQTKDNKSAPSVASFPLPVRSLRHGGLRQWRSRSCLGLPAWLCGDASASNRTASNPHKPDWIYCNSNSLKKNIQNSNIYIYINFIDACIPVPGLLRPLENNSWQLMKDGKVKSQQRNTILAGTQQMQLSSLPSLTTRIMPCVLHATDVLVQASLVVTALRRPKADKALQLILLISMEKGWATIMYTAKKFFRQHAHHSGFSTCCC